MEFEGRKIKRAENAAPNGSFRAMVWGGSVGHGEFSECLSIPCCAVAPGFFGQRIFHFLECCFEPVAVERQW